MQKWEDRCLLPWLFTISPHAVDCDVCALVVGEAVDGRQSAMLQISSEIFVHDIMLLYGYQRKNQAVKDSVFPRGMNEWMDEGENERASEGVLLLRENEMKVGGQKLRRPPKGLGSTEKAEPSGSS